MSSVSARRAIMQILVEELGTSESQQFQKLLDEVLVDMQGVLKKIEKAYSVASDPTTKVLLAGIHSDVFNVTASSRDFIRKLKKT